MPVDENGNVILDSTGKTDASAINATGDYYKTTLASGLSLAGQVTGIIIAVHRKSGFWGGVGWWLVIGFGGGAVGYIVGSMIDGKPKT